MRESYWTTRTTLRQLSDAPSDLGWPSDPSSLTCLGPYFHTYHTLKELSVIVKLCTNPAGATPRLSN